MNDVPQASRVVFRTLTTADPTGLQTLFDRCSDFFVLSEGVPAGPRHALDEMTTHAPGKTADDTFFWGLYDGDELVGFLNVARDYPKPTEWWLAFLLLDPRVRRGGLGAEAHAAMLEWAAGKGAKVMWLGVLAQNTIAERFWRRLGYTERERQQWTAPTGMTSTMILMSRDCP